MLVHLIYYFEKDSTIKVQKIFLFYIINFQVFYMHMLYIIFHFLFWFLYLVISQFSLLISKWSLIWSLTFVSLVDVSTWEFYNCDDRATIANPIMPLRHLEIINQESRSIRINLVLRLALSVSTPNGLFCAFTCNLTLSTR